MLNILKQVNINGVTASYKQHNLIFKQPSGTSRGVLTTKKSYFFFLRKNNITAIGECGLLQGLSCDDVPEYEEVLQQVCSDIANYEYWLNEGLINFPSIRFGLEMALLDWYYGGNSILFPSAFTANEASININGLIWMGTKGAMQQQIEAKLNDGFKCLKLKIGAIDFNEEIELLKFIRESFSPEQLEIRVDANGAFNAEDALEKLNTLSAFSLHSIEQPIKAGQWQQMAQLCKQTPFPIALDEELIGIHTFQHKQQLLAEIKPQYIILKPSLLGGIESCNEWIELADRMNIGWWITSALESNIGLNAIAQYTFTLNSNMPQGLGTGQLYTNNFESPLTLLGDRLFYNPKKQWQLNTLLNS